MSNANDKLYFYAMAALFIGLVINDDDNKGSSKIGTVNADFEALVQKCLKPNSTTVYETVLLHPVTKNEVDFMLAVYNIDITGFIHVVDESGLRHVIKKHMKNKFEPFPLTVYDLYMIPILLTNYDTITTQKHNKRSLPTLIYNKQIEGNLYQLEYVAEVRKGRKFLALNTMYKKPLRINRKG